MSFLSRRKSNSAVESANFSVVNKGFRKKNAATSRAPLSQISVNANHPQGGSTRAGKDGSSSISSKSGKRTSEGRENRIKNEPPITQKEEASVPIQNSPANEIASIQHSDASVASMNSASMNSTSTASTSAGSEKSVVALRKEVQGLRENARSLGEDEDEDEDDLRRVIRNKDAEIDLQAEELSSLNAKLSRIQRGLTGVETERKLLKEKVGILETAKKQLTDKLANQDKEIKTLAQRLQTSSDRDEEIIQVKEVLSRCYQERDLLVDELNRVTRDRDAVAENLSGCLVTLNRFGEEKKQWEREREELISSADRDRIQHKKSMNELNNQLYQEKSQVRLLEVKLEEASDRLSVEELFTQIAAYEEAIEHIEASHSEELEQMRSSLEEKQSAVDALVGKVKSLEQESSAPEENKQLVADNGLKHDEEIRRLTDEYNQQIEIIKGEKDQKESLAKDLEAKIRELQQLSQEQKEKAEERMASLAESFEGRLTGLQNEALEAISALRVRLEAKHKVVSSKETELEVLQKKMASIEETHQAEVARIKNSHDHSTISLYKNQQDTIASLEAELEEKSTLISSFQENISRLKSVQVRLDIERSQSEAQLNQHVQTLRNELEQNQKLLQAQEQEMENNTTARERQDQDLQYELERLRGLLEMTRNDHNQKLAEVTKKHEAQLSLLEEERSKEISSLNQEIRLKDEAMQDHERYAESTRKDQESSAQQKLERAHSLLAEKESELNAVKQQLASAKTQNISLRGELKASADANVECKNKIATLESQLSQTEESLRAVKEQLDDNERAASLLLERRDTMEETLDRERVTGAEKIRQLSQVQEELQKQCDRLERSNADFIEQKKAMASDYAKSLAIEQSNCSQQRQLVVEKDETISQLKLRIAEFEKKSQTETISLPKAIGETGDGALITQESMEGERRCSNLMLSSSREIHRLKLEKVAQEDKLLEQIELNGELSKKIDKFELQVQEMHRSGEEQRVKLNTEKETALRRQSDNLELRSTIKEKEELLNSCSQRNHEQEALLAEKYEEYDKLQQKSNEQTDIYERKVAELQDQLVEQDSIIAALEVELEQSMESLMNANTDRSDDEEMGDETNFRSVDELRSACDTLILEKETSIAVLEAEIIKLEMENKFLTQDCLSSETVCRLETELQAVQQERETLIVSARELKRKAEANVCQHDRQVKKLHAELERLKGELSEAREEAARDCALNRELTSQLSSAESKLKQSEGLLAQRINEIADCHLQVARVRKILNAPSEISHEDQLEMAFDRLSDECTELRDMLDRLRSESESDSFDISEASVGSELSEADQGGSENAVLLDSLTLNLRPLATRLKRKEESARKEESTTIAKASEISGEITSEASSTSKTLHGQRGKALVSSKSKKPQEQGSPAAKTWHLTLEEECNLARDDELLLDLE